MFAIGYDIGSSSIKAALVNLDTGETVGLVQYPEEEMAMYAEQVGWAEQDPEIWWDAVCKCSKKLLAAHPKTRNNIRSIGISYQMHGLVLVDKEMQVIRPSIIWCDSRAVEIGDQIYAQLTPEYCDTHLLNSPSNFTAAKLAWVKENEPENYGRIHKMMLPGDYIAMRLTGNICTTATGLSEGIFWDFKNDTVSDTLLEKLGFSSSLIPEIVNTSSHQGIVSKIAADVTGLDAGILVSYRAGDQANNALSLTVLEPGEIAATGGTSGVAYGVSDKLISDSQQRVNSFAHVNHSKDNIRIGQLLCINGAGSQYAWIKKQITQDGTSYTEMESRIEQIPVGSNGLRVIPFGNGAERMLNNKQTGAHIHNLQFHMHSRDHIVRAALEGIAFSFVYGIRLLQELGVDTNRIKVGNDNLFQSKVFSSSISNLLSCEIEMMDTTGAIGAAQASGIAIGAFESFGEAVSTVKRIKTFSPNNNTEAYSDAYRKWENDLITLIKNKTN